MYEFILGMKNADCIHPQLLSDPSSPPYFPKFNFLFFNVFKNSLTSICAVHILLVVGASSKMW